MPNGTTANQLPEETVREVSEILSKYLDEAERERFFYRGVGRRPGLREVTGPEGGVTLEEPRVGLQVKPPPPAKAPELTEIETETGERRLVRKEEGVVTKEVRPLSERRADIIERVKSSGPLFLGDRRFQQGLNRIYAVVAGDTTTTPEDIAFAEGQLEREITAAQKREGEAPGKVTAARTEQLKDMRDRSKAMYNYLKSGAASISSYHREKQPFHPEIYQAAKTGQQARVFSPEKAKVQERLESDLKTQGEMLRSHALSVDPEADVQIYYSTKEIRDALIKRGIKAERVAALSDMQLQDVLNQLNRLYSSGESKKFFILSNEILHPRTLENVILEMMGNR